MGLTRVLSWANEPYRALAISAFADAVTVVAFVTVHHALDLDWPYAAAWFGAWAVYRVTSSVKARREYRALRPS